MNWIVLQRLHQIYEEGKTKINKTLLNDAHINYLLYSTKELYLVGKFIYKGKDFNQYYELYCKDNYEQYKQFLERNNLKRRQTRFKEEDIKVLIGIEQGMENGNLHELRNQIIKVLQMLKKLPRFYKKGYAGD